MARTLLSSREIGSVQRNDLDTTTTTQAIIAKVIAGTNISLSSTGVDAGTGDVTINLPATITLAGQASPSLSNGGLAYDTDTGALTFKNAEADISMQIGQENWVRVYNNTGSTITNGSAVYINGASSGLPTIALAQANSASTLAVAGLATHDIETASIGYITSFGAVRNLNTNSFVAGPVYLSSSSAGGMTQTVPTSPNYEFRLGNVSVVSATLGVINVQLGTGSRREELVINNQTANYQLVLADYTFPTDVQMNVASANNLTVPPNSTVAFPIGTQIIITQKGAGQTSIVAGGGVTITNANLKLRTQWSKAVLEKTATDTWDLSGDLEVVDTVFYKNILQSSGSHVAARVAGTYALGQGDPAAISGTGTLYPIHAIYILSTEYPAAAKMRINAQVFVNDVAPTGNFTFGLYPITRPATSGGAALNIYTLGTVVTNSTALFTAPAADSMNNVSSSEFTVPTTGYYVIGFISTATVATSSHMHMTARLQAR